MGLRPRSMVGHRDAFIAKIWKCWWYKNFPKLSHNIGSGPIILPTLLQIKVYGAVKNHICSAQNSNNRTRKIILTWFYEVHFNFWLSCDSLMPPWSPEHWSQILMMLTFSLWRGLPTLCKAEISKDLLCLEYYKWEKTWALVMSCDHEQRVSSYLGLWWSHFDQFSINVEMISII